MPFTGLSQNLNNAKTIFSVDGVFDDFFSTTTTTANFTDNTNNTGSSFVQGVGELRITAGGTETQAVKAQNLNALSPARALPWPIYVNYVIEQGLTLVSGVTNLAGVAISHADEDFTTTNKKFWVGLFWDGAASANNGIEIVDATGTSTQFTSFDIVRGTFYLFQVELIYSFEQDGVITINAWIDDGTGSTKVIDASTFDRGDLFGNRVDGSVGIVAHLPTDIGGVVVWDYWVCKRVENFLTLAYEKTALFSLGEFSSKVANVQSQGQFFMGPNSIVNTYARNSKLEPSYSSVNSLSSRLIMRLDFNGNSLDSGSLGFNGTLQGDADDTVDFKGFRKVLDLDGTGDYVDLPDINIDWTTQGFSFAFFLLPDGSTPTDDRLFSFGTDSNSNNHGIQAIRTASADSLSFTAYDSGGTGLGTTTDADFFSDRIVTHCIITVTSVGAVTIYKDNVSAATGSISSQPTSINRDENGIGMRPGTDASSLDGKIWDFRVWNRVITSGERTRIFEAIKWHHRWTGIIKDLIPDKKNPYAIINVEAKHYSSILDSRPFEGSFATKTTDHIIADGSAGIITLNVTEFSTTNVNTGQATITKTYVQDPIREILLQLGAEENYLLWVDEDLDVHSEPLGANDNGKVLSQAENNLINYQFPDLAPPEYTTAEVHGTNTWTIIESGNSAQREYGHLTKVIVDNNITTQAEAERVGRIAIHQGTPIVIGTVEIVADYSLLIGDTVSITIVDPILSFTNKKFVVVSILEDQLTNKQVLTVAEQTADLSDFLYQTFLLAQRNQNQTIDTGVTKTNTIMLDFDILVWIDYLVETSPNGSDWTNHDSGRTVTTNRSIAIISACLGNADTGTDLSEGDFTNGLVFQIGVGIEEPTITDTALSDRLTSEDKAIGEGSITFPTENGSIVSKASATWDNTDANGQTITEAGFYADRQAVTAGLNSTTFAYATSAFWAPNNTVTDLHCHTKFTAFSKTSSNHMRITFTVHVETAAANQIRRN